MLKANPRTWDEGRRCDECCTGDRCDDPDHHERRSCPYCYGTGWAIWTAEGRDDYIARGQGTEACIAAALQSRLCHGEWVRPGGKCRFGGEPYGSLRDPAWRQTSAGVQASYELYGYLVYETKFGGHWDFHPKDELPAGNFLKHREHTPVYVRTAGEKEDQHG